MIFHHIQNENGIDDVHWYVDLQITKTRFVRNMLIDTGASISTLGIKSVARLYEQSEKNIIKYLTESSISDKLVKRTATNDEIELYGIYIRNIKLDDTDIPILKVYTRLDGYVSNLIGMDILKNCEIKLDHQHTGIAYLDISQYSPIIEGSAEIKSLF